MIQLTLTLPSLWPAQVIETAVTVNNSGHIQGYVHPDDQTQPTFNNDTNEASRFFFSKIHYWNHIANKYALSLSPVFPI